MTDDDQSRVIEAVKDVLAGNQAEPEVLEMAASSL